MEQLAKIMGSGARVKIMRLFLFNNPQGFDIDDVIKKSHVTKTVAKKELTLLEKTGFLKKKKFAKTVPAKSAKAKREGATRKKQVNGYVLDEKFPLIEPLHSLLIDSQLVQTKDISQRIQTTGKIKMLVLSGIFLKDEDRKLDILVVGDNVKKPLLDKVMATLESEIGKELRYAVFSSEEFVYRLDMYDKLLRDVFDYKHERIIDRIKPVL